MHQSTNQPPPRKVAAIAIRSEDNPFRDTIETMFDEAARVRISANYDLIDGLLTKDDIVNARKQADQINVLFGSWGFPILNETEIGTLKNLEHIFYAAGSIKPFGLPFLSSGIPISTAQKSNATAVAKFCQSLIILAAKGFFSFSQSIKGPEDHTFAHKRLGTDFGMSNSKVGLIGCGQIARNLIPRIRGDVREILVVDPYLSQNEAQELGTTLCSLEEVFKVSNIVSNHLPNLPELAGALRKEHFSSMQKDSVFINTGRGAQVRESDLCRVLARRGDIQAILDVTSPEPPDAGSPLYSLPNVTLTPHIAGCFGSDLSLLAEEAISSSEKWLNGQALDNTVSVEQFNISA